MNRLFQYMDVADKRDDFNNACDELFVAKYILSEAKISSLLQVIASSKQFYDLFSRLLKDFDFSAQFKKSRGDIGGKQVLILPPYLGERAAFVFCLLLSIDTRETDFKLFLHTFFSGDNPNDEYTKFAASLIVAFKNCVNRLLSGEDDKTAMDAFADSETDVIDCDSDYLNNVATETLLSSLGDIISSLERCDSLEPDDKEEVALVAAALKSAVKSRVKKQVKVMFISLRAVLKTCVVPETSLLFEDFAKLLKEYAVI